MMAHPAFDPDLALSYLEGRRSAVPLLSEAARLRDEGKGRTITYSRKVFIPLTTLCRDSCTYCTFAQPPRGGGMFMPPDQVLAVAQAGEAHHCTEALFTLGDRPEERWPAARAFLDEQGCETTIEYTVRMSEMVNRETALFPHANPGVMTLAQMQDLRPSNPSMGLMLENISPRLTEPGMPHHNCPDKVPSVRVKVIEDAGRLRIPFTTGILVGIGENSQEIVDSLVALASLAEAGGHIQEVIIQNFRAKYNTPMRLNAEPIPSWFMRVVALARWIMGPEMNIQVPPNLTERYEMYLQAGINDWGGVSPLTIDWVNPEAPWPHLEALRRRTESAGFRLLPRLPVYPSFLSDRWIDTTLLPKALDAVDSQGFARSPQDELGARAVGLGVS
ncbi:MAG: 7,8-didemethyl-8-hydroxy-5-deazariboflavin synthase CofG [Actinomycetia bacterium]|nr:7,8-didemethyl-8-hydroxy-5-deazariboflavin synthase CofG [Actinomycetes bacterium]